jgi:outer membrane biosynthesis protein TonB
MTSRHLSSHFIDDREFYLILAGSFAFYLLLIFFFYMIPFDLNRPLAKPSPPARKIAMVLLPPQSVSKPIPPPPIPKPEKKKDPVRVVPKKSAKAPPPPSTLKKEEEKQKKEIPPQPTREEIERKNEEAVALQKAKELEKNRAVATSKFSSLFGNATDDVLQDKGLNVIATSKPSSNPATKEAPGVNLTDDLRVPIKNQEADRILKGLPSGKDKPTTPLLGEHETKHFASDSSTEKGESIRSPEEFERSFKAYEGRLKSFYDKTIQVKPSLKGVMIVKITIAADGTVARCDIISSSLNDKKFENEIARTILEQFRFSKIAQGEEYHDRALNFHPEK